MPTKKFPSKSGIAWLKQLALPTIDRLEMDHLLVDLEQVQERRTELERVIAEPGSSMARWLLAQVTIKVLRRDARLREWFKRLKRRRGASIARVAVMRKLATILWHMLSKRRTYAECRALAEAATNEREQPKCA
jgi:hypothetical protein